MIESTHNAESVRHVLVESPSWDTKQRCACGAEFVSRCEMWKHQADAYLLLIDGHKFVPDDLGDHGWPSYTCMVCGKRKGDHNDGDTCV